MWYHVYNLTAYFVAALLAFVAFVLMYYKHAFNHWKKLNVPHLEPSFPFGNMKSNFAKYIGQQIAEIYQDMKNKGHKYCGYYLFGAPVFMPISSEMNKYFLITDFKSFSDRGFHFDEINDPMGASLVTFSGEKWKRWREKLTPMFTSQKTKMMLPIVQKCTQELDTIFTNYNNNGEPIPIQNIIKRYTVDVICCCAFGVECNCLKDSNSEFFRHANMIFTTKILDNLRLVIGMCAPIVSKIFKIQLFNPTATTFFRSVVKDTIKYRETNNIVCQDFLNLMIRLKHNMSIEDEKSQKSQLIDQELITDDQIAAQCFLFYIAGFETTSSVLSFALYELAYNPDIQQKLREDIMKVSSKYENKLNYECIAEMRYLDNVLKECLRKYPTVHMLNRIVSQDFVIPETNIVIKKGTKAMLSTMGLHRDPEYYPNPEKFDPDRFSDENKDKISPFAYLPFGGGPRICPGMRFGVMESKLCLATVISKFSLIIHPSMKPLELCSVGNVLGTEHPILLKAEKLNNNNNNK